MSGVFVTRIERCPDCDGKRYSPCECDDPNCDQVLKEVCLTCCGEGTLDVKFCYYCDEILEECTCCPACGDPDNVNPGCPTCEYTQWEWYGDRVLALRNG